MMKHPGALRKVQWVSLGLTFVLATQVLAYSTGITGVSGKQGSICNQPACHGGGVAPTVSLEGPEELAPNAIATFRFVVRSNSPQQIAAGLDVAASMGTLRVIAGQGTQLIGVEITHTMPKANDNAGQATFEFQWQAPAQPGSYTLFAAGNSVNRNGTNQGDLAAATRLVVRVVDASPTPTATAEPITPTATPSATPSPTATVTPERPPCVGDCNGDQLVTIDELVSGVNIALGLATVERCFAMDANGDGEVTIDELLQAVNAVLFGCPSAPQ